MRRQGQNAFLDILLTNTNAGLQNHSSVNAILKRKQKIKNESYYNYYSNSISKNVKIYIIIVKI